MMRFYFVNNLMTTKKKCSSLPNSFFATIAFFFLSKVTGTAEIELVLVVLQCSRFGDYNDRNSDVKYMKKNLLFSLLYRSIKILEPTSS